MDDPGWIPPGYGGGNRLTGAEVCRALFRTKDGFFILFGTLFGGVPALIAAAAIGITVRQIDLERNGLPARATVIDKRVQSGSDSTFYYVDYEFAGPDGRTYRGDYSASRQDYYSKEIGDLFEIRYARDDPARSTVMGHPSVPLAFVLPFLSLFVLTGGVFVFVGARGLRRRLKLYGKGIAVWGKSLGIQDDPTMCVNNRPCRLLEFEYVDLAGRTHVCRSAYLDEATIKRLEGLESIPVVYLPERPAAADLDLDRL